MHRRRSSEGSPEAASRACRLPPRGLGSIDSVRPITDETRLRFLVRRNAGNVVIAGLAVSLLIGLTISPFADYSPQVSVSEQNPLTGTRGSAVANQSCQSVTLAHLINDTSLDYRNGWWTTVSGPGGHLSVYDGSPVSEGYRITIAESSAHFERCLYVPIQDYETINASLQLEVVSGSVDVNLLAVIRLPDGSRLSDDATTELSAGQTESIAANLPLEDLKVSYPEKWFWEFWIAIYVSADEQTETVIRSLNVDARSSEILTPVTIDLQTTGGESLLSDPYNEVEHFSEHSLNLLLNLSRTDDARTAIIDMQVANETFYLPVGSYSARAAWSHEYYYWADYLDFESADLDVTENQSTFLRMRLPSVMLSIDVGQCSVAGHISMYAAVYGKIYDYDIGPYMRKSFYMPAGVTGISVDVSHYTPWGHTGHADYTYEPGGLSNLLVTIDYPHVVLLGVVMTGLDMGIIMLFSVLVVALLVRFRHELFPKRTQSALRDPSLIPFLMILVGAFLPWCRYDVLPYGGFFIDGSYHAPQYSGVLLPQLAVITQQTHSGLTAPYVIEAWFLVLPLFVAFFWIPLLSIASEVGTKEPALSLKRAIPIVCPAVMALVSGLAFAAFDLVFATSSWMVPDIGIWIVLLAPVAFFIEIWLRKVLRIS